MAASVLLLDDPLTGVRRLPLIEQRLLRPHVGFQDLTPRR